MMALFQHQELEFVLVLNDALKQPFAEEIAKGQNIMFVRKQYAYEVKARVVGAHRIAQITSHSELLSVDISEDALSAEVTALHGTSCSNTQKSWILIDFLMERKSKS